MSSGPYIACARCAISKTRCDRKVPCSQCIARDYVCQPRYTSRKPRAPRKPTGQSRGSTASADANEHDGDHVANIEQFPNFMLPGDQPPENDLFEFASTAIPEGSLDIIGYEELIGLSYSDTLSNNETTDGNASNDLFSSMPWIDVNDYQSGTLQSQVFSSEVASFEVSRQQQNPSRGPSQLLTPTSTTTPTVSDLQNENPGLHNIHAKYQNLEETHAAGHESSDNVLRNMVDSLTQPSIWQEIPGSSKNATQVISHDTRDLIVANVQLLLLRAMQTRFCPSPSSHSLLGRIVVLPPSHVLVYFVELYAARIDSIQSYLGLAGSLNLGIEEILQVNRVDIGILLVILLITQGAMLTDHRESLILAHGLTEICRVALNGVLESRSMAQPMVGESALQLLTLCAWSGKHSFALFAMSKRGQYLSNIKYTGLLQPGPMLYNCTSHSMDPWERWKEHEQKHRHAYAWVYVDLELSILYDLPPILSINDLHVPLPQDTNLWHAQSYSAWLEHYGASGIRLDEETQSLNSLFRSFLQGRLINTGDLPFHHLRLLLHPLQTMVLEQQELLRIFETDEQSNRYRVLSRIKVLGRLQETQDMLQQLTTLLDRALHIVTEQGKEDRSYSMGCVSMIMLHLVCLSAFTSIPEIERCAKKNPPASDAERAQMWRWARYPEGQSKILFHSGQIFRLVDSLHISVRPSWWPIAVYRASLACWSLRMHTRTSPASQLLVLGIDTLLANEEDQFLTSSVDTAFVTLPNKKQLPVLERNNSLQYCIGMLERHPTQLVQSVLEKVRSILDRWSS